MRLLLEKRTDTKASRLPSVSGIVPLKRLFWAAIVVRCGALESDSGMEPAAMHNQIVHSRNALHALLLLLER